MKKHSIKLLMGASIVAIIALLYFQIKWMEHSRHLMEEQFKNRVQMALCSAVEKAATSTDCMALRASCGMTTNQPTCRLSSATLIRTSSLDSALAQTLSYYQLNMPYEVEIFENAGTETYSCSLAPLLDTDEHYLGVNFPTKSEFLLSGMGFMFVSSILILLFISFLFGLASYYLIRQKKISDLNREFFNHMAHEFRTPLTNIKLASGLLQKEMLTDKGNRYLHIIKSESSGLMEQVEKVLDLSQIERKEYQLHKEPTDIKNLIQQVISEMELQIKEKSAHLEIHLPAEAVNYTLDQFHFSRLLRNLIDNALKYSQGIPEISLGLNNAKEYLSFQITDNGPGLSQQQQQQAFKKYSRFHSDVKGFGLGLAYVKKIVELHGGEISLGCSRNLQGTAIRFQLPK